MVAGEAAAADKTRAGQDTRVEWTYSVCRLLSSANDGTCSVRELYDRSLLHQHLPFQIM